MYRGPQLVGFSIFAGVLLLFGFIAEAALPPSGAPADQSPANQCIKASLRGEASTYEPGYGYKGGTGTLATGGPYNANSYDAALQLDLARRYRCGYGQGKVCHAIVQAPNGLGLVVRVNDNGPLNVPGRIIDLNTKSMAYLSGGTKGGRKGGTIKNVTVTLLCGVSGMALGPLDPKDREAWANRTFDTPYTNTGGYRGNSVSDGSYGSSGSGYASGGANASSGNTNDPNNGNAYTGGAGTPQSSQPPQNPPPYQPSQPYQPYQSSQPIRDPALPTSPNPLKDYARLNLEDDTRGAYATSLAEASIYVQPSQVSRGRSAVVSWDSVGMSQSNICRVTVVQGGRGILVGQSNESSRQIKISDQSSTGTLEFTVSCTSLSGDLVERTASLVVQ